MWAIYLLVIGAVAGLLVLVERRRGQSSAASGSGDQSDPFADGDFARILSEAGISEPGLRLHARVDQVYELSDGELLVVETKTRASARVYLYDMVEMSVARFILARAYGKRVKPYGAVRFEAPGRRREYRKVALLSDAQVLSLVELYRRVTSGARPARPNPGPVCAICDLECPRRAVGRAA